MDATTLLLNRLRDAYRREEISRTEFVQLSLDLIALGDLNVKPNQQGGRPA